MPFLTGKLQEYFSPGCALFPIVDPDFDPRGSCIAPPPRPIKKMAAEHRNFYFMYVAPTSPKFLDPLPVSASVVKFYSASHFN